MSLWALGVLARQTLRSFEALAGWRLSLAISDLSASLASGRYYVAGGAR